MAELGTGKGNSVRNPVSWGQGSRETQRGWSAALFVQALCGDVGRRRVCPLKRHPDMVVVNALRDRSAPQLQRKNPF
jgi:hypothetical protein